jgi:hypothetical protein
MTSTRTKDCPRCDGTGYLASLSHIQQGRCFRCEGTGTINPAAEKAAKEARKAEEAWIVSLPSVNDLTEIAVSKGLRYRKANDAAETYRWVLISEVRGAVVLEAFTAEEIAAAVTLFRA